MRWQHRCPKMREHSASGSAGESSLIAPDSVLKLAPNITAAEALAVFQRKLPDAEAEVREVLHPFWWTALRAWTRGVFTRSAKPGSAVSPGQRMNVLVNACSGKGYIADFEPRGESVAVVDWVGALDFSDQGGPQPGVDQVRRTSRSLVRTKVVKTVKLGMSISIDEAAAPSGVLKPNWIVTGANEKFSATILVDGLDSSHYIVRVEKLTRD